MASSSAERDSAHAPTGDDARITNLDAVRGVAVLGILPMNVVLLALPDSALYHLDLAGTATTLDWVIGVASLVLFDQKFMGLFSMLFGAGVAVFADRASAKARRPIGLSLWRNALLLAIGIVHSWIWDGDILVVYAVVAPLLLMARDLGARALVTLGVVVYLLPVLIALVVQPTIDASGAGLGTYWYATGPMSDGVTAFYDADYLCRALGMMLIGIALHRRGVLAGGRDARVYRRMAACGLGLGLPLAAAGVVWVVAADFSPTVALVRAIPNTLGTIPATLGYLALITLWNHARESPLRARIRAVGRMALTNYLSQSLLGVAILGAAPGDLALTRTELLGFVAAVWALQLAWSSAWLARYRFGPAEWLWRCATYRAWQPLRRADPSSAAEHA